MKKTDKLLTIAIPAYNSASYLGRCLESLLISESLRAKVQVIIMNDGSRDSTSEIAHDYAAKYPQLFTVIDKENGNYGSCMNRALSIAEGKFFRTLDSDDTYDKEAFSTFLGELELSDADMIFCERYVYYEETSKRDHLKFNLSLPLHKDVQPSSSYWEDSSLLKIRHVSSLCYKTELLRRINFHWDENVFYTDTEYDFIPLRYVHKVRFVPSPVYVYFIGRNDQSTKPEVLRKNFHSLDVVANRLLDDFVKYANTNDVMYPLQKSYLMEELFLFYLTLRYDGLKHRKEVEVVERKLGNLNDIYSEFNNEKLYFGPNFIKTYRQGMLPYLVRLYMFRIKRIKWLRRIFGKQMLDD